MDTLFDILHVAAAVFIVGPMAILPMTGLRGLRSGDAGQVRTIAKATMVFSWLSLLVVIFGFGLLGVSPDAQKYHTTFLTPWILWSIIAWLVAFALNLFVVVPRMNKAADELDAHPAGDAAAAVARPSGYGAIAASNGIASLLLVVVVVLMIWKP
jgi:uncharacterized membrane protein